MVSDEYNQHSQNGKANNKKLNGVQDHKLGEQEPGIFVEMSKPEKHKSGIFVDMSEPDKYEHTAFVEKSEQKILKSEPKVSKSEPKVSKSESKPEPKYEPKILKSGDKSPKPSVEIIDQSYFKELDAHVKNLGSTIEQLAAELKKSTDAKSWEALSQGTLDIRRYANYYDVTDTITTAGSSDPNDFDSPVYNVERVFEYLERYSEIIYVANDGTDILYAIVSHGGRTRFSQEAPIYPGEIKCYFNVYEIRLRSPTAGLPYRVTEYCIRYLLEISDIPIEKANLHNQALPVANANWLATDITPTNTPTTFMIDVAVSIAGVFSAAITKNGIAPQTVNFNLGAALVANSVYTFNLLVHSGDSVNFRYSTTTGTILILRVQEFDSASA